MSGNKRKSSDDVAGTAKKHQAIMTVLSRVPRLTLLDLQTNWTYKRTLGMELVRL